MQYASSEGWLPSLEQLARSAARPIRAGWTAYVRHRERINAMAELRTMDDHMLADMGISRCGIESAIQSARSDSPLRSRE
jgi:uncharacterized protein YjiS (DUF1127 family)